MNEITEEIMEYIKRKVLDPSIDEYEYWEILGELIDELEALKDAAKIG